MSYFVQCNVCQAYTHAGYDAEGFRWMEKHDETCPEPSERES